jgi:hypothetical protein
MGAERENSTTSSYLRQSVWAKEVYQPNLSNIGIAHSKILVLIER